MGKSVSTPGNLEVFQSPLRPDAKLGYEALFTRKAKGSLSTWVERNIDGNLSLNIFFVGICWVDLREKSSVDLRFSQSSGSDFGAHGGGLRWRGENGADLGLYFQSNRIVSENSISRSQKIGLSAPHSIRRRLISALCKAKF